MAYINRVKNTANQPFNLRDSRLDSGEELNVKKDWLVNDTTSSKYITNRTHYVSNRFELMDVEWDGSFVSEGAPTIEELQNDYVIYKLSNSKLDSTTEIITNFLEKTLIYYKPYGGATQRKTYDEIFSGTPTITTNSVGTNVTEIVFGVSRDVFTLYNVAEDETITIQGIQVDLTEGIYVISLKDLVASDIIRVLRYEDEVVKLPYKYIPNEVLTRLTNLENTSSQITTNYATIQYVDNEIDGVEALITNLGSDLNNKMDKVSPEGSGDFKLRPNAQNLGGRALIAGDIFANYNFVQGTGNKVATESWTTAQLANKMNANNELFAHLYVGTAQNNERVLTVSDLASIDNSVFKGYFGDNSYLSTVSAQEGDYAYVWSTYQGNVNEPATATKYVYTNNGWRASSPTVTITNTFTPTQWRNINTSALSLIAALTERVADLEDRFNTMFERAEGQDF